MPQQYLDALKRRVRFPHVELPETYRDRQEQEGIRVLDSVLTPGKLDDRKILVVGGGGYIGTVLCTSLLTHQYQVRSLDLLLYENECLAQYGIGREGYEFMRGDMGIAADIDAALEGITDVIILAGLVGDPITKKYPDESALINDQAVIGLIDRLNGRGLNKVIFVSTCSNYGVIPDNSLADEGFELKPLSLYANSKVAAEKHLIGMKGRTDYAATVMRFATAFGLSPRMRFDLTVSEFTRDLYAGDSLDVYDADTWRPYCHVQDFSAALIRVLEAPVDDVTFEIFNAGGDANNFTKAGIVEEILRQLPGRSVNFVEGGGDRRNYKVDFRKIRETLLFEPKYSVPDGIRELIGALDAGFFRDYDSRRNFYRNQEISYSRA